MAVYLDNAATTAPAPETIAAVSRCLSEVYGNPSSLHKMGLAAELLMENARKVIAQALGTQPECIVFTSGATESSNLALRGAAAAYGKHRNHIITSAVEHASVKSTADALESAGFEVTRIFPNRKGEFAPQDFIDAVTDKTCLISMMLVENETGYILPVKEVFRSIKKKHPEIITHCDAVQGFLKLSVHVNELCADMVSISAHKIHGPKGTGALFLRKGVRLQPIVTGGKQERGLRPGTEAVPLIAGFTAAVEQMLPHIQEHFDLAKDKQDYLYMLLAENPEIMINSAASGSPYITNFSVKGIRSEIMLHFLESKDIYVSSGSACSKGAKSGVLSAYGISDDRADCALRVSFSEYTTKEELELLARSLKDGQEQLIHKY